MSTNFLWTHLLLFILTTTCFTSISNSEKEITTFKCNSPKGWKCAFNEAFSQKDTDHSYCDFDVITLNTSLDEFIENYYMKKPVAINTKLSDWTNTSFWEKQNLLQSYGNYKFDVGKSLKLVLSAGVVEQKMSLKEYVDRNDANLNNYTLQEPLYIFDRTIWHEENHKFLSNHIHRKNIKFFDYASTNLNYNAQILAMGPTGTGASWHAHGENWLFMIMGQKRVFLYPPNLTPVGGFWPGYSSKDWFQFVYPRLNLTYNYNNHDSNPNYDFSFEFNNKYDKLNKIKYIPRNYRNVDDIFKGGYNDFKPLECIAHPGQIVYIPEFWWHSVLNVGDAAGIAVQTSHARQPWMLERDIHDEVRRNVLKDNHWSELEMEVNRFEGIKAYNRLKHYGPLSAVHEFFMGFEFYDMGNKLYFPYAIKHFNNAILMDETYIEAYKYLSRIYSLKGKNNWENKYYDLEKAENLLRIAYLLNPNNEGTHKELMDIYRMQNDKEMYELIKNKKPLPFKTDYTI
eukprot:234249_1